jgi:hypothetical protein
LPEKNTLGFHNTTGRNNRGSQSDDVLTVAKKIRHGLGGLGEELIAKRAKERKVICGLGGGNPFLNIHF